MARFRETSVFILDVSPSMGPYLPSLRRAAHTYLHSKLVDKLQHEVAIVLFGTVTTDNEVNQEQNGQGCTNIVTLAPLAPPTLETLQKLDAALDACAQGNSTPGDFVDGLTVGIDVLVKALEAVPERKKSPKRVILVSNFLSPTQDDPQTTEFVEILGSQLVDRGAMLQVVSLDIPVDDAAFSTEKNSNCDVLDVLLPLVDHSMRSVTHPADLGGVFPLKEYAPITTYASTQFEIGNVLKIPVKLALKTQREKFPTIGKESPLDRPPVPGEGDEKPEPAGVQRSTDYYREDDTEKENPIEDDEKVIAYRYGRSLVPMDANNLGMASYSPSKTLQLLGFTSLDTIPRHYYMSHTFVMVANKDIKSAGVALAALVQAMVQSESVAILRFVRTTTVEVLMAQPVPASGVAPAHFILNAMPFREDIRTFPFGSFDRDDRRPTQAQLDAALHLVDSMPLTTANKKEDLVPENTANPALHRFIDFFVDKALDSGMQVQSPEDDMMLQRVLTPSQGITPGASEAAALAAVAQFPTGHAAKALRRAVRRLSAGHEVEDFKTMMEQQNHTDAIYAMRKFIENTVDSSPGDLRYDQAVEVLKVLRQECVLYGVGAAFNTQLRYLDKKYAQDTTRGGFWKRVGSAGVTLISSEEAKITGAEGLVSPGEAEEWLERVKG